MTGSTLSYQLMLLNYIYLFGLIYSTIYQVVLFQILLDCKIL